MPGRVLQLLQESIATTTRGSEEQREQEQEQEQGGRDILVVLESPDLLLHTDGLGYSGVMDLVMGVLEVFLTPSFLPSLIAELKLMGCWLYIIGRQAYDCLCKR